MKVLIIYGSTDGMTVRIAARMAGAARAAGHETQVADAAGSGVDPTPFDVVLVGASMHAGGYQRSVRRWVRQHLAALKERRTAFFSVCLSIASKFPREREEAQRIARAFPAKVGWIPDRIEVIAGALMFSRYGFLRRLAMKRIARYELGSVDASRDHIYTDWEAVDRFTLEMLAGRKICAPSEESAPAAAH